MESVKKINDELTVATGQVTPEQLQQAADEGYKSVMNLRDPLEEGFVSEEPLQAEAAGLHYVNVPVKADTLDEELADLVMLRIDDLPKPALIHCKSGMRSGAMALTNIALHEGLTPEETFEKAQDLGFNCDSNPKMKEFVKQYIEEHAKVK